jgi:hypothetical protein
MGCAQLDGGCQVLVAKVREDRKEDRCVDHTTVIWTQPVCMSVRKQQTVIRQRQRQLHNDTSNINDDSNNNNRTGSVAWPYDQRLYMQGRRSMRSCGEENNCGIGYAKATV